MLTYDVNALSWIRHAGYMLSDLGYRDIDHDNCLIHNTERGSHDQWRIERIQRSLIKCSAWTGSVHVLINVFTSLQDHHILRTLSDHVPAKE